MKKSVALLLAAMMVSGGSVLVSANEQVPSIALEQSLGSETKVVEIHSTVVRNQKHNSAIVCLAPEDFLNAGFQLGDSCDIEFDNGHVLTDIPFYNGYYVKNGAPLVVAYPGQGFIQIARNNQGLFDEMELQEGDGVTIRLHEAGKYYDIYECFAQTYSLDRSDYNSDIEFCNFRTMQGGNLKENLLYRGASPVDNRLGRAAYTDALLRDTGIQYLLDLSDTPEDMEAHFAKDDFCSEYAAELYHNGKASALGIGSGYGTDVYKQKVVQGMREMLSSDTQGPVYIHCVEGKDRTGFVCFLLESLAGASYDEMAADYMVTYKNYYSVTEEGTPVKYDAIKSLYFDAFAACLHGTEDLDQLKHADYTQDAVNYLVSGGMTLEEVSALQAFITK